MNNEQIERVAKALCAETCAHAGEPPCYSVEGDWPNPECDEPGCHTLAARAIAAMQPAPAVSVAEAAKVLGHSKAARNAAFNEMWRVATETYSLEATNGSGARYSITGDVINALWYAMIRALMKGGDHEQSNLPPDAQAIREAIEKADLRFQDIGNGYRPPMPVEALIRDLDGYAKCMPSPHRAQNVMAMAAKLLRALLNKENTDG